MPVIGESTSNSRCPKCGCINVEVLKSLYIASQDYTEEMWGCNACDQLWKKVVKVSLYPLNRGFRLP